MDAKVIGKYIKEYRKSNNVSQRELAEKLFVSDKTISRWELGNGLPDIELLPKIAEILGISIDKLVGAENEEGEAAALDLYREELKRREELLAEREKQAITDADNRRIRIKKLSIITGSLCVAILLVVFSVILLVKPQYTLTVLGVSLENGATSVELYHGDSLPSFSAEGKTVIGFIDDEYNFYDPRDFRMPDRNVTLRALIKEDMPIFAGSDKNMHGMKVAEHVLTDEGIPATKYTFEAGFLKGTSIQSRPVEDSGEMQDINVYAPSLGKRLFLMHVQNTGDIDVNIRYRVENFGNQQGGLDYYTPSVTIKANSTTYLPVFFENNSGYGVFEGCDHFVILDQDIEEKVELIIFGYIYTAEELDSIEIVKAPDKYVYQEGEPIDLSGMVVRANLVMGSTTGKVTIYNYDCDLKGATWTEGMNKATVSFAGKTAEVDIYDPFLYKIAFTPAKNLESIGGSNGADFISADYVSALGNVPATRFTIKAGATVGMEVEAWINQEIDNAMIHGQNLRIPTFADTERYIELIVTNNGGQEISFRYYAENYGDKGGVNITIAPGETQTLNFKVNPGPSIGCNYALKLLSDVSEETSITMYGYFHCKDELERIEIFKEADKKAFAVGEKFSANGLVIKAICREVYGNKYDDVIITNFKTSLDDYVFTSSDVGTKTVVIHFADFSVTYDVEIVE